MIPLNAWEVAGKLDHSHVAGGNVKWSSHCGKWMAAFYKIKYVIITQSSNCTLGYLSQGKTKENLCSHTHIHLYKNVHNSFIHNSQKLEKAQRSFNKLWYTHTVNYSSAVKRNKCLIHAAAWVNLKWIRPSEKKPIPKDYILCDFMYRTSVKWTFYKWRTV